jgi:quinol monooxygenase YgiN
MRIGWLLVACLALVVTSTAPAQDEKKADFPARIKAMKGPFTLIVHFEVKKGEEAKVIEAAKPCIAATRKEKGCVSYDLHQDAEEPTKFTFVERWKGPEALLEHLEAEHTKALLSVVQKVSAGAPKLILAKSVDDR